MERRRYTSKQKSNCDLKPTPTAERNMNYIKVTGDAGQRFFSRELESPIVMLNLLQFKEIADYSESPLLKPNEQLSGFEAYRLYMKAVSPLLAKIKSEVLFQGKSDQFLIGPQNEQWDLVLLVKHHSKKEFLSFASNPEYLKIEGHRTAALKDSRLLPVKV